MNRARVLPFQRGQGDAACEDPTEVARLAGRAAQEALESGGVSLAAATERVNLLCGCTLIWPGLVELWLQGKERPDVVQWLALMSCAPPAEAVGAIMRLVQGLTN